jgi:hypothetical protein
MLLPLQKNLAGGHYFPRRRVLISGDQSHFPIADFLNCERCVAVTVHVLGPADVECERIPTSVTFERGRSGAGAEVDPSIPRPCDLNIGADLPMTAPLLVMSPSIADMTTPR